MCMPDLRLMLAQAGPAGAELTVGTVLMGACIMAALTGSLGVLAMWWARYSRGESVIPMANRTLPRIPVPKSEKLHQPHRSKKETW